MKSNVKLSFYSLAVTIIVLGVLIAACIFVEDNKTWYLVFSVTFLLLLFASRYSPIKIMADDRNVTVKCLLRRHEIRMKDIESVEMFQPTMGAFRLCGSGGFMGYWGLFREGDVGNYTAYYGKASECFMIRMKNGDKYLLGCENPQDMCEYIQRHIS